MFRFKLQPLTLRQVLRRVAAPQKPQNRYVPHNGLNAQARRLKQIQDGRLKGDYISDGARLMAHGMIPPPEKKVVRPGAIILTDKE